MKYKINKGMILSLASNPDVFIRGEKYWKENKVTDLSVIQQKQPPLDIVTGIITGNYQEYHVTLNFSDQGYLKSYRCDCEANKIWRGCCKHVVAVLLEFLQKNAVIVARSDTSQSSLLLTKIFEEALQNEISALSAGPSQIIPGSVRLSPVLHLSYNHGVELSLTIGAERMYVVKNIRSLMVDVKQGNEVAYGKNFTFNHSRGAFDRKSNQLLDILEWHFDIYQQMAQNTYNTVPYSSQAKSVSLTPVAVDSFFAIYPDDLIEVESISPSMERREKLLYTGEPPDILFTVEVREKQAALTGQTRSMMLVNGKEYTYLVMPDTIGRLSKQAAAAAIPIQKELNASPNSAIEFTGDTFNKFMTYILPRLRRHDLLDPASVFEDDSVISDLHKRVYLDYEGKDVSCKVLFQYGNYEINPLQTPAQSVYRDLLEEQRFIGLISAMGFVPSPTVSMYLLHDDEKIYDFYRIGVEQMKENAEVYVSEEFSGKEVRQVQKISYGIRLSGNMLELNIDTSGYSMQELLEAVSSFRLRKRFHRLRNGEFVDLEDRGMQEAEALISSLDLTKKELDLSGAEDGKDSFLLPAYRALYLDEVLKDGTDREVDRDVSFQKLTEDFRQYDSSKYAIPEGLAHVLRNYQKTGFRWLSTLSHYGFGGILADDMGLGKTIQVITILAAQRHTAPNPSLIVAPTSLIYNWEHEIRKFAPELQTVVIAGLPAKRRELIEAVDQSQILITTYDLLKRDVELYSKHSYEYIIADEAQYIKNPQTQNATMLKTLNARVRFALTGTPIENSLSDLWSIFDFIMPGYLHSYTKFSKLYESDIVKNEDKEKAGALQKQISPFILRRLKQDVLKELPEKVETTLYAEMESEQKKIYAANLLKARGDLDEVIELGMFRKKQIDILAQLTRLRQICCHPGLFIEGYKGGSGKLEMTMETIDSALSSGHRLLLFSQFTSMLSILRDRLDDAHVPYYYLDGSTEAKLRASMVDSFNSGERDVFLISLKAGGTGLNLTGADVVIHYDQWWNPAVMNQAADRAHRYGQKKIVQVINIITKDSIEEKILDLQNRKKDLVDAVIREGGNFISGMTVDEVKALFM